MTDFPAATHDCSLAILLYQLARMVPTLVCNYKRRKTIGKIHFRKWNFFIIKKYTVVHVLTVS